ncbi:MAG: replicative DNA helicase [Bacilli bacterium]|jgi:replicative DNA helicase|nr:replicative DNA helicase [Bacilli bacterium]
MAEDELNEAEKAVLGGCIQNKDIFYRVIGRLTPEDFSSPANQLIFTDLAEQRTNTGFADSASFLEYLKSKKDLEKVGGQSYIMDLVTYQPLSDEIDYYLNIVMDKALSRRFFREMHQIEDDYNNKSVPDISEFIGQAEKRLLDITGERRVSEFRTTEEIMKTLSQKFKEDKEMRQQLHITESYMTGYPTGYEDVDRLSGGFHPADLIILAARPSVGKTALALNFAEKMAKTGKAVGIFSLEMSAESVLLRILSEESSLPTNTIKTIDLDNLSSDGVYKDQMKFTLSNAIKTVISQHLLIDDTSALKLADIVSKSRKLKAKFPDLSLIIIDYLGLITAPSKGNAGNRQQEVSDITRGLKAMARDLEVPVMVLCQLSRGVENRNTHRPVLSDLRDSGSIEQDADMVFFIFRSDYYPEDEDKNNKPGSYTSPAPSAPQAASSNTSQTTLILAKNRNGPIGDVNFTFYRDICRFEALANDERVGEEPE